MPSVLYLKSHCQPRGHLDFLVYYFLEVLVLHFIVRSVIHLKLFFVKKDIPDIFFFALKSAFSDITLVTSAFA